jgi:hypothetical protein
VTVKKVVTLRASRNARTPLAAVLSRPGPQQPMNYEELEFKIPVEAEDYAECSKFVTDCVEAIMKEAIETGRNKIFINTNLRLGLPMENINKIAGPFVEAWAQEIFCDALNDGVNKYQLINVEAQERLAYG